MQCIVQHVKHTATYEVNRVKTWGMRKKEKAFVSLRSEDKIEKNKKKTLAVATTLIF